MSAFLDEQTQHDRGVMTKTVAVIGAGCIGLSIARSLSKLSPTHSPLNIILIEAASTIASKTSSRNSSVIHAGIYYPPNSLKAELCVTGKQQLFEYCASSQINLRRCGKVIIDPSPNSQISNKLEGLLSAGRRNNVADLSLHTEQSLHKNLGEKNIHSPGGALFSPNTAVFDSNEFTQCLYGEVCNHGNGSVDVVFHTKAKKVVKGFGGGLVLTCVSENDGDIFDLEVDHVVNAAGLWASYFEAPERDTPTPRTWFARGNYLKLRSGIAPPFSKLVYPLPDPKGGLGIHSGCDVNDLKAVRFGPDVNWINPDVDADFIEYGGGDEEYLRDVERKFETAIARFWDGVGEGNLEFDYCGIRPKLHHPDSGEGSVDFVIEGEKQHGVKGLVNLFGIESPGLTSSLAIGDKVARLLM